MRGPPGPAALTAAERFVVIASGVPTTLCFTILTPIMAKAVKDLAGGAGSPGIRLALTIVGMAMMVGSPVAGWLADRTDNRAVLLAALLAWLLVGLASMAVPSIGLLTAARFAQGIAAAIVLVIGIKLLGKVRDEIDRARLAGHSAMLATVSGLVSLVAAGMLGDIQWRYVFLLHLVALPGLAAALALPREDPTPAGHERTAEPGQPGKLPLGLMALAFFTGLITFGSTTYMPFRFEEVGVHGSTMVGFALTAQTITSAITAALFGRRRGQMSQRSCFVTDFLLTALGAVIAGVARSYALAVLGMLIFGLGLGGMMPNLLATVSASPAARRGRMAGAVKALYYGAAFIGAILLEPVMRSGGAAAAMLAIGAIGIAATLTLLGDSVRTARRIA